MKKQFISTGIILSVLFVTGCVKTINNPAEKNKQVIREMIEEGINKQNFDIFEKCLSPDYVRHCQSLPPDKESMTGIESYTNFIKEHFTGFPDYKEEIIQLFGEGDMVSIITKGSGNHTGQIGEFRPTG